MITHAKQAQWQWDERLDIMQKLMLSALKASLCIVSHATDMVNDHIKGTYPDVDKIMYKYRHYAWLENNETYKMYFLDLHSDVKDFGESQLHKLMIGVPINRKIKRYDKENKILEVTEETSDPIPDKTAVIFYNKTKNKDRGYIERNEITGKDGDSIIPNNMGVVNLIIKDPDPDKK